ncbi:hypothetical protein EII29_06850 [Leptotrichia sp. OH3620_COT-345]|uniref:hypothetical protein n=1 Tax=Leptotrichia sp. OH3620_COT-345 TaxID=2491048 RepID=UPI000F64BC14|nr:hypothetical protein [Leptotrichia sp. OH3620_COT-345]RRD39523.1 hypothetical protein EII29_06850 [Leptotrichia sp. OH3620_COT-345]
MNNIGLLIILYFVLYFFIRKIRRSIKLSFEKLEELNGEFIYTFLKNFSKKEMYFNLEEVHSLFFTQMIVKNGSFGNLTVYIILEDEYAVKLQKKENIITFFKSCKENKPEMYEKFLESTPMGIDISAIMDKEIEDYKNSGK